MSAAADMRVALVAIERRAARLVEDIEALQGELADAFGALSDMEAEIEASEAERDELDDKLTDAKRERDEARDELRDALDKAGAA